MGHEDWESWDAEEPPRDFGERVVAQALRERRTSRRRVARIGAGVVLVASVAAVMT